MQSSEEIQSLALTLLQDLLRLDTSNPPGNEVLVTDYIARMLSNYGISARILAKDPRRPNLFAELSAQEGTLALDPLLLSSHVDVVPAPDPTLWRFPPFAGTVADGHIWGRGAIDMKYKTAFDLATLISIKKSTVRLKRTLKFLALADEEVSGEFGAAYVCAEHLALIRGSFVFNELGGFRSNLLGKDIMLIQTGEKSCCHLKIEAFGQSEHASIQYPDHSILLLARVLTRLREEFLSYTVCEASSQFFSQLAALLGAPYSNLLHGLLQKENFQAASDQIPDAEQRAQFVAMLTNTINPTKVQAGYKINVVPEYARAECDCRLIPGVSAEQFCTEIEQWLPKAFPKDSGKIKVSVQKFEAGYTQSIGGEVYDLIVSTAKENWRREVPELHCMPYLLPAASDCTKYAAVGLKPFGFAPLLFPADFKGLSQYHAIDEHIPLVAFRRGLDLYQEVVRKLVEA